MEFDSGKACFSGVCFVFGRDFPIRFHDVVFFHNFADLFTLYLKKHRTD